MKVKHDSSSGDKKKRPKRPFRTAVIRGLGIVAPPLFTVLIFVWVMSMTHRYVLKPVTAGVRESLVWMTADIREDLAPITPGAETAKRNGRTYHRVKNGTYVPLAVYDKVSGSPGEPPPDTARAVYRRYVTLTWLQPYYSVPFFLAVFVLLLYLLGKFMAAGIGRVFWNLFERGIHRLPLIRNVYSSVKQVSDFLFTEREIEYTRVVAVEYPRKGIWSLGMVTGESLLDIRSAANEAVLSVLIPTSPMPVTGYTITVLKSETVDLNITIDQAFQFVVSCGVVIPPQQLQQVLRPDADREPQSAEEDASQPAASNK